MTHKMTKMFHDNSSRRNTFHMIFLERVNSGARQRELPQQSSALLSPGLKRGEIMGNLNNQHVTMKTERLKVLKVVGEKVAQVVLENDVCIDAIKIDKIDAMLGPFEDHVFKNKVVKQGVIHKQVFYVDHDNVVRHMAEDVPYMLTVDIPNVRPGDDVEVQNHLQDIDVDYQLIPGEPGKKSTLRQKIVAHILVKVSEWTQVDVVTDVKVFPRVNSMHRISVKKCY